MPEDRLRLTPERLRKAIKTLSQRPTNRKPTAEEARVRLAARDLAQRRLDQIESSQFDYALALGEIPAVRRFKDHYLQHSVDEQEVREYLRGEPEPLPDTASPAVRAVAEFNKSAVERQRELTHAEWPSWTDEGTER